MSEVKQKKKRGRKSNKEIDKIENYDPEKTSDVDNLILNLKGGDKESKNILPGFECNDFCEIINENNDYNLNKSNNSSWNCCWNCCHEYNDLTISIPHQYIKDIFYINGNFCSYECAARYIFDTYTGSEMWDKISLLNNYYNTSVNKKGLKISPAPSKLTLKKFGGNLDIEEYRKSSNNNQYYNVYLPPIIPISQEEYCYEGKIKNNELNGGLRLYRKKPMNNKNNIYDTMNLKVNDDS